MAFSTDDFEFFLSGLARSFAEKAKAFARPKVAKASKQLASAMQTFVRRGFIGIVHIPHYWAEFVHDGRKPFSGRTMVWWRNPKDDPRLSGGRTPERVSQLRSLTRSQWLAALALRREWVAGGGTIFTAPVIITNHISKPTRAVPFFGNGPGEGMEGFAGEANRIGTPAFRRLATAGLEDVLDLKIETVIRI